MAVQHDAAQPIPVLVNRQGGSAAAAGDKIKADVETAFRDAGLSADVDLLDAADMRPAVERLDAPMVVVGGGDGTLGAAASILIERGRTALGLLPLGTHNHFARQLGIPADLPGAVRVLAEGARRRVDVGTVNGHIFLNNASIGFYPTLVRSREHEQHRRGLPKWMANMPAAWAALRRLRHHRLRVEIDGAERWVRTPLLFVGNNLYSLDGGRIGQREALDRGELSLFSVKSRTRLGALWFGLRLLAGRADLEYDFGVAETCRTLTVHAHSPQIHVALDGEVRCLESPLYFEIKPGALEVIVGAEPDAAPGETETDFSARS